MNQRVDTRFPTAVEVEAIAAFRGMFPQADRYFVHTAFGWAIDCFSGKYADYQPIDAQYHDFEHTLQGTLCMVRLLRRRHMAGGEPQVTQRMFELGLLAILLHDTGYLKKRDDTGGTGAKYTLVHVNLSCDFAGQLLRDKKFVLSEVHAIQNMIRCTGVNADLKVIPFQSDGERMVGYALGTADLLGQMAADDYVDKLPVLYSEFAECIRFTGDKTSLLAGFTSAEDLMRKTPGFWEKYVFPKVMNDFQGLYRFLNDPYPDGPNYYVQKIEANLDRLRRQLQPA